MSEYYSPSPENNGDYFEPEPFISLGFEVVDTQKTPLSIELLKEQMTVPFNIDPDISNDPELTIPRVGTTVVADWLKSNKVIDGRRRYTVERHRNFRGSIVSHIKTMSLLVFPEMKSSSQVQLTASLKLRLPNSAQKNERFFCRLSPGQSLVHRAMIDGNEVVTHLFALQSITEEGISIVPKQLASRLK